MFFVMIVFCFLSFGFHLVKELRIRMYCLLVECCFPLLWACQEDVSLQTVFSHCNEGQHWGRCLSGFFLFFYLCMYVYVYTQLSAAKRTRTQNFARPDCGYVPTLCLAVIQEAWFSFAAHYVWMNVHEFCYILVKKKSVLLSFSGPLCSLSCILYQLFYFLNLFHVFDTNPQFRDLSPTD